MTEDIEEQFRAACSAYLAAVEQADSDRQAANRLILVAQTTEQAADRARDHLLQVVRERDAAAQLTDSEGRIHPSDRAAAARDRWLTSPGVSVMPPEDTDYWAQHGGMCPECGVSWRRLSPDCPHKVVNWHPLDIINPSQM